MDFVSFCFCALTFLVGSVLIVSFFSSLTFFAVSSTAVSTCSICFSCFLSCLLLTISLISLIGLLFFLLGTSIMVTPSTGFALIRTCIWPSPIHCCLINCSVSSTVFHSHPLASSSADAGIIVRIKNITMYAQFFIILPYLFLLGSYYYF